MAQAQGKYTKAKIEGFAAALQQNVSVVCHGIRAQRYFHFDLNAGCGRNEIAMCDGSPIAFRAAACKAKMPQALSFCCERDGVAAKRLAERCRNDHCTLVINGRNQDVVEQIPYIIRAVYHKDNLGMGDEMRLKEFPWESRDEKQLPDALKYLGMK